MNDEKLQNFIKINLNLLSLETKFIQFQTGVHSKTYLILNTFASSICTKVAGEPQKYLQSYYIHHN